MWSVELVCKHNKINNKVFKINDYLCELKQMNIINGFTAILVGDIFRIVINGVESNKCKCEAVCIKVQNKMFEIFREEIIIKNCIVDGRSVKLPSVENLNLEEDVEKKCCLLI